MGADSARDSLPTAERQTQWSPFCQWTVCLIEMESFHLFLVAADQQPGHCSKSQNRRKCDGNGSNLQHLKDNWCRRIAGGKVG